MGSAPYRYIEKLQGDLPWGSVLDAGAGVASVRWLTQVSPDKLTAVTAAPRHYAQVQEAVRGKMRDVDRLVIGNWMDPQMLASERFETVVADYLLGAVECFSPFFQDRLFQRLRPLVGKRLYVVGLDPYIVGLAPTPAARLVREIGRIRDSCQLLADETPFREFPAEWVVESLQEAGFIVRSARRFPNRYKSRWINSQLDMALQRLPALLDNELSLALSSRIEKLRAQALALSTAENGLRYGSDYVIAAEVV